MIHRLNPEVLIVRDYLIKLTKDVSSSLDYVYVDNVPDHFPAGHVHVRYSKWPGGAFSHAFSLLIDAKDLTQTIMQFYPYGTKNSYMHQDYYDLHDPAQTKLRAAIRERFDDVRAYQERGWRYTDE